jgi:SAM-dependent methyltransferase
MPDGLDHDRDRPASMAVSEFFDQVYQAVGDSPYWWRHDEPYATNADAYPYSLLTQMTLRLISHREPGRALDLGAGDGADSIRLARLGYDVTAVDISAVAADRIKTFADRAGERITIEVASISEYEPAGQYDLIICNGVLHYVQDKTMAIGKMQRATRSGGLNVISLWSDHTPVPDCHAIVPVFCDAEKGVVMKSYDAWKTELLYFERGRPESAHEDMPKHSHSHIKMISRKPSGETVSGL